MELEGGSPWKDPDRGSPLSVGKVGKLSKFFNISKAHGSERREFL
jgi:hypothetical protein